MINFVIVLIKNAFIFFTVKEPQMHNELCISEFTQHTNNSILIISHKNVNDYILYIVYRVNSHQEYISFVAITTQNNSALLKMLQDKHEKLKRKNVMKVSKLID